MTLDVRGHRVPEPTRDRQGATNNFFKLSFPMPTTTYVSKGLKTIDTGCYNGIRRSLAGPSTVRGADASVESVWGRRSRPNEPQRKSDTDTRVDPKTSPVPRLEGNPPAVRRAFLFYGKKARRAVGSMTNHRPNLNT